MAADPNFANKYGIRAQAQQLGLLNLHSTLLQEARRIDSNAPSRGAQLTAVQSKTWADGRVREGVAKARAGDQKAALERYDAALELCPRHKEGLVGRGAALVNVGRLHDALRDFDLALKLDPADANAKK